MKNLKGVTLAAAGAAAVAILVPLYGDPRQTRVTHPEWAQMLMRALDMESVLASGATATLAFDSLSWRTTMGVPADRPFRSVGVGFFAGPPRFVRANADGSGELAYRVGIARSGDYRVRLKLGPPAGPARAGVTIEWTPEGGSAPTKSLTLAPAPLTESPGVYLSPGVYTLSVALPPQESLEWIEIVPPCVNSIEPKGGWQRAAIAQTADVAVTVLKALDLESELPPAAAPIEVSSEAFQPTTSQPLRTSSKGAVAGFWLEADSAGLQAVVHVDLPEPGLYTVYGYGLSGGGQSWVADGCLKTVLCPTTSTPESPSWKPILTTEFSAGRHSLAMTLANGAGLQRVKLERKKDGIVDYLGTVTRLGLALGEQRPIPRALAVEAMKFIETRRATLEHSRCGDVIPPAASVLVAGLAIPGGGLVPTGSTAPLPGPGAVPLVPLPGPSAAPAQPGPIPSPAPSTPGVSQPSPAPSPSPASSPSPAASPSIGPPPTTLAQPPASPVKE